MTIPSGRAVHGPDQASRRSPAQEWQFLEDGNWDDGLPEIAEPSSLWVEGSSCAALYASSAARQAESADARQSAPEPEASTTSACEEPCSDEVTEDLRGRNHYELMAKVVQLQWEQRVREQRNRYLRIPFHVPVAGTRP